MSDTKGPKVSMPEELMEALEGSAANEAESASATPSASEDIEVGDPPPVAAGGEATQKELADLKDKYLRLAAEFDNYKRRMLKERNDLHNYANEGLIKELLGTVDNLERASEHGQKDDATNDISSLLEGIELTYRSLKQLLDKSDVRVVDPAGAKFDPQVQEAMRQVPCDDKEPGTVVEVYQKGYLLKDRLLRPALVAVSSRPEAGQSEESKPDSESEGDGA